jgi:hypothetical protein
VEQVRLPRWHGVLSCCALNMAAWMCGAQHANAQPVTLYAGHSYDGINGSINPSFHNDDAVSKPQASWALLNNSGTATWFAEMVPSTNDYQAMRFSPLSGPPQQLNDLSGPPTTASAAPYAINAGGAIVGRSRDANGRDRPIRWDPGGTTATLLDPLDFFALLGPPAGQANDINDSRTAVGFQGKSHPIFIESQGNRAVRWNAAGDATELANISSYTIDSGGGDIYDVANAEAYAINNAGIAVGYSAIYEQSGLNRGRRAVRWNATGMATELGHLGLGQTGSTTSEAWAVNEAGDAVGFATKFDVQGLTDGQRAVRWNAGATEAVELQVLGTDPTGNTISKAYTLNEAGTAVGWLDKFSTEGIAQGTRAVTWNATGAVTELGALSAPEGIPSFSQAFDINEAGLAAGMAGDPNASRAVYWTADGMPVDLNTLIAPNSGWVLERALAISDTGWIAGIGKFDDGSGGVTGTYDRVFMLQLPAPPVLAGDYNDDGSVDAADYVSWRDNLNTANSLPNDTTPESIAQVDYDVWRANFGATAAEAAGLAAANSVPEPVALALALLGIGFLPLRIRK